MPGDVHAGAMPRKVNNEHVNVEAASHSCSMDQASNDHLTARLLSSGTLVGDDMAGYCQNDPPAGTQCLICRRVG